MYITGGQGYYDRSGQQYARRGDFLILVQDKTRPCGPDNFRAIVRKVALRQLGNFMMGFARVKGQTITVSGAYGSDGLPVSVSPEVYAMGIDVPRDLYDAWSRGGGWNSAGSESGAMREWAKKAFNL